MKSWKKKCPDFEIIEWNEDNFNVNINQFCKEAYREKKWAFVSDYARIWILYNYGGVYLDTDIELLKNIEPLLINKAFTGFEGQDFLQTGIMGCEKNDPIMRLLLEKYEIKSFYTEEGKINMTPNVVEFTDIFRQRGLILNDQFQMIDGNLYRLCGDRGMDITYISSEITTLTESTEDSLVFQAVSTYCEPDKEEQSNAYTQRSDIFTIVLENGQWKVGQFTMPY